MIPLTYVPVWGSCFGYAFASAARWMAWHFFIYVAAVVAAAVIFLIVATALYLFGAGA